MSDVFRLLLCAPAAFALALVLFGAGARGSTLDGSTVSGSLVLQFDDTINRFDAANGGVPPGFLNSSPNSPTVVIASPAKEFGYGPIAVDFNDTTLLITEPLGTPINGWAVHDYTFTDSAFAGLTLIEQSDTFTLGGMNGSLVGDTLTLSWGGGITSGNFSASYSFVPEPAGLSPLALSSALALLRRRRGQMAKHSGRRMLDNPTLHWTGPAEQSS